MHVQPGIEGSLGHGGEIDEGGDVVEAGPQEGVAVGMVSGSSTSSVPFERDGR